MNRFAERLERMTVTVRSPDRRILATLKGRGPVSIAFAAPDVYDDYPHESAFESQVAAAITAATGTAERGRRSLIAQETRLRVDDEPHWDPRIRRIQEAIAALTGEGESQDRAVRVTTTGLWQWRVSVTPGTLDRLSCAAFCASLNSAIAEAYRDYADEVFALKKTEFGKIAPERQEL